MRKNLLSFIERYSYKLIWIALATLLFYGALMVFLPLSSVNISFPAEQVPMFMLSLVIVLFSLMVFEVLAVELGNHFSFHCVRCAASVAIILFAAQKTFSYLASVSG